MPIVVDYSMVVIVCVTIAFWTGILIDGFLIHPFEHARAEHKSSIVLFLEIVSQFVIQGLIALAVTWAVRAIPSPVSGWQGYSSNSPIGNSVRMPALVLFAVVLFSVSSSLQARITYLLSRFDKNTCPVRAQACLRYSTEYQRLP